MKRGNKYLFALSVISLASAAAAHTYAWLFIRALRQCDQCPVWQQIDMTCRDSPPDFNQPQQASIPQAPASASQAFVPEYSAKFTPYLRLSATPSTTRSAPGGLGKGLGLGGLDPIGPVLRTVPFSISWRILKDSRRLAGGSIDVNDLMWRSFSGGMFYVFRARQRIPLKAGQQYYLVADVQQGSTELNQFTPTLMLSSYRPVRNWLARAMIEGQAALWFFIAGVLFLLAGLFRLDKLSTRVKDQAIQ